MMPRTAPTFPWWPRRQWVAVCIALGAVALLANIPQRDAVVTPPSATTVTLSAAVADQPPSPAVSAMPAAAATAPPLATSASPMPAIVPVPRPTSPTTSEAATPTSLRWVASSWLTALIVVMAAAVAYLWTVLPTLTRRRAVAATGGACAALALAGWALAAWADAGLAGSAMAALLVALPILTLVSGHGGYALANARRAAPATTVPAAAWRESTPAAGPLPISDAAPVAQVPPPDRTLFGNFRIEGDLGRGAMGVVYLGRHQRTGQRVALKTLTIAPDDDVDLHEAKRRFLREAALATRLRHPDIVAIVGSGEEHGQAYIAMEYVEGHDLCRHTSADALLPLPVLIDAMARVAEALAHAHSHGVIHRDIKPSNLMWNPVTRQVKVADFGVARVADGSRTSTGVLIGTPTYLAPEQLAGRKVDHRTDLYALGVTMFQLITGQAPMRAESMARLMYAIANIPAPDVRRLRPDAPPELASIVALLLEKQPDDRYADGRTLAADLRAVLVAAPVPSQAPTTIGAPPPPATGHNSAF